MAASPPEPRGLPRLAYIYAAPLVRADSGAAIDMLDSRSELESMRKMLAEAHRRLAFRAQVATIQNLRTLVTLGCRILHYSGHGLPHCLAFETESGALHELDVNTLRDLFGAGGSGAETKLVFVSACHSHRAGMAFVSAGVEHVVAVQWDSKITDKGAHLFAEHFYLALLTGKTVRAAFQIAEQMLIAAENRQNSGTRFLLLPENGDHDEIICADATEGTYVDETPPLPPNSCEIPPTHFVGRQAEMQSIFQMLQHHSRCVTVTGQPGVGKSALALAAAHYLNERRLFRAVHFVKLSVDQNQIMARAAAEANGIRTAEGFERWADGRPDFEQAVNRSVLEAVTRLQSSHIFGGGDGHAQCARSAVTREAVLEALLNGAHAPNGLEASQMSPDLGTATSDVVDQKANKTLLILDGADDVAAELLRLLSFLFSNSKNIAVLTTSRHQLQNTPQLLGAHTESPSTPATPFFSPISVDRNVPADDAGACGGGPGSVVPGPLRSSSSNNSNASEGGSGAGGGGRDNGRGSTSIARLECEPEKLIHLDNLDPVNAAALLVRRAPRKLLLSEMGAAEHHSDNQVLLSLADQPTVRELNGHPRAITVFAPYLAQVHPKSGTRMKLDALQSHACAVRENAMRPRHLTNTREEDRPNFQRACERAAEELVDQRCVFLWARLSESASSMDYTPASDVAWRELTDAMATQLNSVQKSNLPPREFTREDLSFIHARLDVDVPDEARTRDAWHRGRVTLVHFAALCRWWAPVLDTIARLNDDWRRTTPVRCIHGMVDRQAAERLLVNRQLGTFLLRLSESHAGLLVISFISTSEPASLDEPEVTEVQERRMVHHCLVTAKDDGCVISFKGGVNRSYATLGDLILDCKRLVYVEPDVPKEDVFPAGCGAGVGASAGAEW